MNLIFSRIWLTKSTNFAKFFIVLAFMLCSFLHTRAEITSSEVQEILTILNHGIWSNDPDLNPTIEQILQAQSDLGNGLGYFLTGYGGPDMDATSYTKKGTLPYMLQLQYAALTGGKLNAATPTTWNLKDDTTSIIDLLRQMSLTLGPPTNRIDVHVQPTNIVNATFDPTIIVTNVVSGGGSFDDILAGNPWWGTNSLFAMNRSRFAQAFPKSYANQMYSFPQFMSRWASLLTLSPSATFPSATQLNIWPRFYGHDRSVSVSEQYPYTWFDYMADWQKSNAVSSASYTSDLLRELRALSNALASVSSSVDVTNQTFVFLTNLVSFSADDILAANPWWATNSNFAWEWQVWNPYLSPWPKDGYPAGDWPTTFPEAFSLFLSSRLRGVYPDWRTNEFWKAFGGYRDSYSVRSMNIYTFEDWLADAFNSNLVLQVASSYSNLLHEYYLQDSDDPNPTNVPLPQYSLPSSETVSGASDTLSSAESGLLEKIESLQPHYTGGDDEIVVIPAFSVGGINVREYRARLSTSITPVCRSVASFIWYVGLFAFLFAFAKSEFVYYASLGKFWVHKG